MGWLQRLQHNNSFRQQQQLQHITNFEDVTKLSKDDSNSSRWVASQGTIDGILQDGSKTTQDLTYRNNWERGNRKVTSRVKRAFKPQRIPTPEEIAEELQEREEQDRRAKVRRLNGIVLHWLRAGTDTSNEHG